MTPLERRYRRTLRLLPAGYRQMWQEDMVDAYMESASHHGGDAPSAWSRAEHLSVVGLAVRLRLSGVHASPRGLASRSAVHGFALVGLLYMALGGILNLTGLVVVDFPRDLFPNRGIYVLYWFGPTFPALLWLAALVTVVLGSAAAARVLVVVAFLTQVGLMIANFVLEAQPYAQFAVPAPYLGTGWHHAVELSVADGVWLAIVAAVTLIAATLIAAEVGALKPGRGRWFWLGGAALLALVQVVAEVVEMAGYPFRPADYVNPGNAAHFGLLVAMLAALAALRNPGWLLALALIIVVVAGNDLLDYIQTLDGRAAGLPYIEPLSYWQRIDFGLFALAAACAAVGVIGAGRLPRAQISAPEV